MDSTRQQIHIGEVAIEKIFLEDLLEAKNNSTDVLRSNIVNHGFAVSIYLRQSL